MSMNVPGWIPGAPAMGCLCRAGRIRHDLVCPVPQIPVRVPDPFRTLHDLGCVPARCSRESEVLEGRSARWLPAGISDGRSPPSRTFEPFAGWQVTCAPAQLSAGGESCNECPQNSWRFLT